MTVRDKCTHKDPHLFEPTSMSIEGSELMDKICMAYKLLYKYIGMTS